MWGLLHFLSIALVMFDSSLCYMLFICIVYCENSNYSPSLLLVPRSTSPPTVVQSYWLLPFTSAPRGLPDEYSCPHLTATALYPSSWHACSHYFEWHVPQTDCSKGCFWPRFPPSLTQPLLDLKIMVSISILQHSDVLNNTQEWK